MSARETIQSASSNYRVSGGQLHGAETMKNETFPLRHSIRSIISRAGSHWNVHTGPWQYWHLSHAKGQPVSGDYGTGAHLWEIAGNVKQRYRNYVHHLLEEPHRNVVLLRYEEMIADLDGWLGKLAEQFEVNDVVTVKQLVDHYRPTFHQSDENEWVHMRKVTPGDYLESCARRR